MHIQDNAGGGAVLGQCSRRTGRLERVEKHWKSKWKGEVGGAAVVSVCGVWLCLQCDMCARAGQDSKKCSALDIHCVYV